MLDPRTAQGARLALAEVAARAEVARCARVAEYRTDAAHPTTKAWHDALARWHEALDRVYPASFWTAFADLKQAPYQDQTTGEWMWSRASAPSLEIGISFLEADLVCFRSGYTKERLCRYLARQPLDDDERRRLQRVVLAALHQPMRREFRAICTLASSVGDKALLMKIETFARSGDEVAARRAGWMRDAISRGRRTHRRPFSAA